MINYHQISYVNMGESVREKLKRVTVMGVANILKFLPIFEAAGYKFCRWPKDAVDMINGPCYSKEVLEFENALYGEGFIIDFDWPSWQEEASQYSANPDLLGQADIETLQKLLTTHVRKERFCGGHLASVLEQGHITAVLRRLAQIHEEVPRDRRVRTKGCCKRTTSDYQLLPSTGLLKDKCNYGLPRLRKTIGSLSASATVYSYVMSSVRKRDGALQHYGCGPNWQGGRITLCTCKHFMRAFRSVEDWPGFWVAGFSNVRAGCGRNVLIYLMHVNRAFESHYALWKGLPADVRRAKAANKAGNIFGDVYRPVKTQTCKAPFDEASYRSPCASHAHEDGWGKDVDYMSYRRPALLVGDVKFSFLWDKPKILLDREIGRGQRKYDMGGFVNRHLCEANQ